MSKTYKQLINNPFLSKFSKENLKNLQEKNQNKNIFFGVGVVTKNHISQGLPIDILSILLTCEQIRKANNGTKAFLFLADYHAATNNNFPENQISSITTKTEASLTKIIKAFNLKSFEIIKTSSLNSLPEIRKIFANLPNIKNQYLKHEVADTIWLNKFHNVGIKIGWTIGHDQTITGNDERFFDTKILELCKEVDFIYLKPGRTFDHKRPRVSPYISIPNEPRILLTPNKNIKQSLKNFETHTPQETFKATKRHIVNIVRLSEIFSLSPERSFETKLQELINKCT